MKVRSPKAAAAVGRRRPSPVMWRTACVLYAAMTLMACVAASLVALLSLSHTGYFRPVDRRGRLLVTTEWMDLWRGMPPLMFLLAVALIVVLLAVLSRLPLPARRGVPLPHIVAAYVLIVAVAWLLALNSNGSRFIYSDSTSLIDAANAIVSGYPERFTPDATGLHGLPASYLYFSWYPFQSGALLWFVGIFSVFGRNNILAVQFVNAILLAGVAWMLQRTGEELGLDEGGRRVEAVLVMTAVPLLMSPALAYTNTAGLCFVMVAMLAAIHAMRAIRRTRYPQALGWTTLCFLVGALAVAVKGTVVLFLIAFAAALSFAAIRYRMLWLIPVNMLLFVAAQKLSGLPVVVVEQMVGQRFGGGLPQLSWIAIGLSRQSVETPMPGWWNVHPIRTYEAVGGDPERQQAVAMDTIRASVAHFAADPGYALHFFTDKLASEWAEPTYESLYYSSMAERRTEGALASLAFYGQGNAALVAFEDVHQSVVYLASAVGFGWLVREAVGAWNVRSGTERESGSDEEVRESGKVGGADPEVGLMLAFVFLGGFGCFLLWEAKSVYVMPFAVMLIPLAALGLQRVAGAAMRVAERRTECHENQGADEVSDSGKDKQ